MTQPRLLPLVVFATAVLLALKGVHLAIASGPEPVRVVAAADKDPFAGVDPDPVTTASGSGGGHGEAAPAAAPPGHGVEPAKVKVEVTTEKPAEAKPIPGQELMSEIAILQKLAERRKLIEQREKELEMREQLLKATEGKIEKRIDDLKSIEGQIGTATKAKEEEKSKEITDLVKMYESMKAKDAARVFDRLDTSLLSDIARQMNPKKLADVVSKMSPEAAEKLTIELANRRKEPVAQPARELPKIDGNRG
ncbi:MotE family protein [Prosthecomicrobium sp. N25]|uniref:MotE family protein n=1 Tax=Prosthecomicrobium sp. N25 TaxID=3129254 RepID=UPI0030778B8F